MTKITETKKYEMIIAALTKTEMNEETVMLVEFCKAKIAAIAEKAEKAKARRAEKTKEADTIYDSVLEVLRGVEAGTYVSINSIIDAIDAEDLTPGKITPRLTSMIKEGLIEKKTITTGDKRRVNGYALIG